MQGLALWFAMRRSESGRGLLSAYVGAWRRYNRPLGRERIPIPNFVGMCVDHWHFFNIAQNRHKGRFGNVSPAFEREEVELAA